MTEWMIRATTSGARPAGVVTWYERRFASEAHAENWLASARARLGLNAVIDLVPAVFDPPEGTLPWHEFAPPPERPREPRVKMEEYVSFRRRGYRWTPIRRAWFVVDPHGDPFPLSCAYYKHGAIRQFLGQGCLMDLPSGHDWWRWFRRRGYRARKLGLVDLGGGEHEASHPRD